MPNQQRTARKCLTDWLKNFRQIKFHGSRVEAVSQLVGFAKEMETELAAPIQAALPLAIATSLRAYNKPIGQRRVDREVEHLIAQAEPAPEPDRELVGDLGDAEKDIPVDFSGVIEARNMETMKIPPMGECGDLDFVPPRPVPVPSLFPDDVELTIIGACPNPRLLQGQLPDGRKVTIWKGPRHWRIPSRVQCRRDPQTPASAPTYLPV